jgi:hypothetical protein
VVPWLKISSIKVLTCLKEWKMKQWTKFQILSILGGGIRISWGLDIKNRKVRYNDSLRYLYKELGEKELRERIQN